VIAVFSISQARVVEVLESGDHSPHSKRIGRFRSPPALQLLRTKAGNCHQDRALNVCKSKAMRRLSRVRGRFAVGVASVSARGDHGEHTERGKRRT
jgi:hypothetical protein